MGIAAGMKDIVQDIASSYGLRMAEVKGLKKEANEMLVDARWLIKGFQASRRKEGAQLRKELAQGLAEQRFEVNAMLGDFRSRREETGSKLREELDGSRSSCKSEVGELLKGAQDLVDDLGKSRL